MKETKIVVKAFGELTTEELYEILKARFKVFVVEQRCFYLDLDDIDYESTHIFAKDGHGVIAYARLFAEPEPEAWHVGHVLTTRRKEGLGRQIMEEVIRIVEANGGKSLRMEAQSHAVGFYQRLGFRVCSEEFEEAGIPHVRMERLYARP